MSLVGRLLLVTEMDEVVWGISWRKVYMLSGPLPSPSQLAGWYGLLLVSSLAWQGKSGRPWSTWVALAASWCPLVAPGRHRSLTSLCPLVPGVWTPGPCCATVQWEYRLELCSFEHLACARCSSNCFHALSHFILTLPYSLHRTGEKDETQGFKCKQIDSRLTNSLGILPLNHLRQMPTVPPPMMTHALGIFIYLKNSYTYCG